MVISRGRIVELAHSENAGERQTTITLRSQHGVSSHVIHSFDGKIGDVVEVRDNTASILTSSVSGGTTWMNRTLDPRRIRAIQIRNQIENGIREFFTNDDFIETKTPLLVPCPGMETHIRPFMIRSSADSSYHQFLPTSPEFAMKRLLVGGLEKIFQISHAFRDEPNSPSHHPEFSLLEWYRAYADELQMMEDTEKLVEFLCQKIHGSSSFVYQGKTISVKAPWPRFTVRSLFDRIGVSLYPKSSLVNPCRKLGIPVNAEDNWDDLFFKIWLNCIEPNLPADQAVFVTHYPTSQAALARIETLPDGSSWARRFEPYAGGLEIGNAFYELTDAHEQRKRFIVDMELREKIYGPEFPKNPLDEDFLSALEEGLPPSSGIAVGVDRLVMLLADEPHIDFTTWL